MPRHPTRTRWRTEEGQELAATVIERLVAGGRPVGLGLGMTEAGRFDLRGLTLPHPGIAERREIGRYHVAAMEGFVKLHGAVLDGLDLSDAVLDHMWLTEVEVVDTVFDRARLRDARVWSGTFRACSFRGADLRDLAIAPIHEGRRTLFQDTDFSGADMRRLVCPGALFDRCRFDGARLDKVDFEGSVFSGTAFAGRLNEVIFRDVPWEHEDLEPNAMRDVDLSGAELYGVEFRNLAMDRVRWPEHPAHERFEHYPCVLKGVVAAYEGDDRPHARGLRAAFEVELRWMHPARRTGVVHREELGPIADETLALMRDLERDCAGRR